MQTFSFSSYFKDFLYLASPPPLFLFLENCELIKCPVDCNVTIGASDQCPGCECPLGQRCRPVQCPGCKITQKLDGCLHCSCSFTTYEFFDESRRMDVFSTNALGSSSSRETCNLQDAQSIEKCMIDMLNFMKVAEFKNPALIAQPLYSMFLYDVVQIGEICGHFDRALRCVSVDVLTRCQNKERHLNMVNSMFKFICNDLSNNRGENGQNLKRYECVRNILVSHRIVDYCSTILSRKVDKAAVTSSLSLLEKRTTKCRALNDFTSCVRPILYTYCGRQAGDFFASGLFEARDTVAPECRRTADGTFEPLTDDFAQSDILSIDNTQLLNTINANRRFIVSSETDSIDGRFSRTNFVSSRNPSPTVDPRSLTSSARSVNLVRLEIKSPGVVAAARSPQPSSERVLDGDRLALLLEQTANARRSDPAFRSSRRRDDVDNTFSKIV